MHQLPLSPIASLPDLPEGLLYRPDFVTPAEEYALMEEVGKLKFGQVRMHGVVARRRVVHYGVNYAYESWRVTLGPEIPPFLLPIRERAAAWLELEPPELAEVLITQYPKGATIGWHRDAPPFGHVVGISLLAPCRMRFHRREGDARETRELVLAPRSAYALTGPARSQWQHHIPPVKALRYSITFRTLRRCAKISVL